MQQVAEQLDALHQPGAGAGERRGGVDGVDRVGVEPFELRPVVQRLLGGFLRVQTAGHRHGHVGPGGGELVPGDDARVTPRLAGHAAPAGQLDHLRDPVAAGVGRGEPLQSGNARAGSAADGIPDLVEAPLELAAQHLAALGHAGRLRQPDLVVQHLAEGLRIERDHLGPRGQPSGDLANVVVGHRANRAQRLRDDQIRTHGGELRLVQLIQGIAPAGDLADHRIDVLRREALGDDAAGKAGQPERLGRVVAFVRDGDHLVPQAEGEERFRRRGDEARDSHGTTMARPTG